MGCNTEVPVNSFLAAEQLNLGPAIGDAEDGLGGDQEDVLRGMALNPEPTETFALGQQTRGTGVVTIMEEPPEAKRKPPTLPMPAQPKDIILL